MCCYGLTYVLVWCVRVCVDCSGLGWCVSLCVVMFFDGLVCYLMCVVLNALVCVFVCVLR